MCAYNRYAIRILHCNNFLSSFLISLLLLISISVATGGNINANDNSDDNNKYCSKINDTVPSIYSNCWKYNKINAIEIELLQRGCDNASCQNTVCACDSYCCDVSWDLSCRGYYNGDNDEHVKDNGIIKGCSASILCCEDLLHDKITDELKNNNYEHDFITTIPLDINVELSYYESNANKNKQPYCEKLKTSSPSIESNCFKYNTDQEEDQKQKGCDHKPCEDAVCACDPYCCDVAWDEPCRGKQLELNSNLKDNNHVPGCSSSILCCEEQSMSIDEITFIDAPNQIETIIIDDHKEEKNDKNGENNVNNNNYHCPNINDATPSIESNCWKFNPSNQKGCDSTPCANAVCACDPYCCDVSWDEACRGVGNEFPKDNTNIPGCSASILCCEESLYTVNNNIINEYNNMIIKAKPCMSDASIIGYNDIYDLLHDINNQDYTSNSEYKYIICPETTLEIKSTSISFPPIYGHNNNITIIISCGVNDSQANNCIITKGDHHIIFPPNYALTNAPNIIINGITFIKSKYSSIVLWSSSSINNNNNNLAPSSNDATNNKVIFNNCKWKNNYGYAVIDIYDSSHNNQRRRMESMGLRNAYLRKNVNNNRNRRIESLSSSFGMRINFNNCYFKNNVARLGIFLVTHASATITNCVFIENTADAILIGLAKEAILTIDDYSHATQKITPNSTTSASTKTIIANNTSGFSTVYVDSKSSILFQEFDKNENKTNTIIDMNNHASKCSNIFKEHNGSTCLESGAYTNYCYGSCDAAISL